ncbi:unnamed protein product [Rhizophagus irregularis]|nr:unnamed protein product [Rhizophagus irregularis]
MYSENKKKQLSKVVVIREETFHKRPPSGPLSSRTLKGVERKYLHMTTIKPMITKNQIEKDKFQGEQALRKNET